MSREAIESFVDEIRDVLPRLRRAFAVIHAWPDDDDDTLREAHRLTHSLKGTAALVGVHSLSKIAEWQEDFLEQLLLRRSTMDDRLRDTLERLSDIIESYATGLQTGSVSAQRLLDEAAALCGRERVTTTQLGSEKCGATLRVATESQASGVASAPRSFEEVVPTGGLTPPRSPIHSPPPPVATSSAEDRFCVVAFGHLREMAERLDIYRRDLTRSDLLADAGRLAQSLRHEVGTVGWSDFATLLDHAAELMQRTLDRAVPPSESIADCLQACADALEHRLDQRLDESILEQLHARIDELSAATIPGERSRLAPRGRATTIGPQDENCGREANCSASRSEAATFVRSTATIATPDKRNADGGPALEVSLSQPTEESPAADRVESRVIPTRSVAVPSNTPPASIELDDRGQLAAEMLDVFHEEAEDHLRQMYSAIGELQNNPARMSSVQEVRRSAHTIKGAAGAVGLRLASKLSHRMEDLLDGLFSTQQPIDSQTLALLYDTTDALQDLVHGDYAADGMRVTVAQLFDGYDALLEGSGVGGQGSEETLEHVATSAPFHIEEVGSEAADCLTPTPSAWAIRESTHADGVEIKQLTPDSCQQAAVVTQPAAPPTELVVQGTLPMLSAWNRLSEPEMALPAKTVEAAAQRDSSKKPGESLRVPLIRIDSIVRDVGELMINRSSFEQRMSDFGRCLEELQRAVARMRNVSRDLDVKYGVGALGGHHRLRGDGASLLPGGWRLAGQSDDEFDALEMDRYTEFHLMSRSLAETTTDIGTVGQELRTLMSDFDQLLTRQGRLSRDTQDRLMRIRLLPLVTLSDKLHRTVRAVAAQQHKEVEFILQGAETEIDKLVLEELADPLMHLLRNGVDHGLEDAAARQAAGKPQRATIRVQAFQQGTHVVLRISDDGRGLNFEAIRETAVRQGLLSADEAKSRSEDELSKLIFLPGFSTAKEISEISGRGVGMDIVRDKVQKLNGTIRVDSHTGQGTTFTIRLPITLAVTRALLLHAANETFAIPMQSVVQVLRLERHEVAALGPSPVLRLGNESLPFVSLADRLGLRHVSNKSSRSVPVLILADGDSKLAIAVDKILPGRDIVVKTLGSHLRKVRGLIGSTLLGDGSVVPILDAADLIESANRPASSVPAPHRPMRRDEPPTILIVDDSVSVRRVMAKLLKSAGWQVLEAKDGLDAIEKLPTLERQPDLFLLDIEMPRIDGYELLKSLRSRAEFRSTPIVMVTSRAGDKHREKAMRLGATDYVVKPYQDKELLALVRDLLTVQSEAALV